MVPITRDGDSKPRGGLGQLDVEDALGRLDGVGHAELHVEGEVLGSVRLVSPLQDLVGDVHGQVLVPVDGHHPISNLQAAGSADKNTIATFPLEKKFFLLVI